MKDRFGRFRFTIAEAGILFVLVFLLSVYWWFSTHIWFRIDDRKVTINQQSDPIDYSCFKSLDGEIFCHNQDNGTQYLISPGNNEIYVVAGEDIIYLDGIVISSTFSNTLQDSKIRRKLPDQITVGEDFIEFTPSINQTGRSLKSQVWCIYD